ncbi:MAG: aminotransferase class V-fold PLP-dependent enzyme [Proteobacteria bacterium]|nr:aminotransferase class V-fold PLP-dependent enzyme [Pseudomonadota bacterium]MBU1737238.1 aminotransferase class V-fold PLP-dependent enzyme [Pseudomonadota bacterium]
MKRIYFDNNATTPVSPEVKAAMLPCLEERFGNPSSAHRIGEAAALAVERAREQVALLFNAHPSRICFTSGGTEANNMAIFSAAGANPDKKHIVTSRVEHPSVLEPLNHLAGYGYEIEVLEVDPNGALDLDRLRSTLREDTALVTLMAANNETGVIWPIGEIGEICKEKGVLFHSDVVQMLGKSPIDVQELAVDYLSMAGHKLHGPKGVGALFTSRTAPLRPVIFGAGQEKGKRPGTENVPGIVGLGKACETAGAKLAEYSVNILALRDRIENSISSNFPDAIINGAGEPRLANTINVCFEHCSSAGLIQELDERGIAVSGHSACHSGDLNPSHVLTAMRVPETHLHGALRISLSRINTAEEVDRFLEILPDIVEKSRRGFAD